MHRAPCYLQKYDEAYGKDPRGAALQWFCEARYGLFLHYGLYSLLGRHEWVQYRECIPVSDYEALAKQFTAEHFDANRITELAEHFGMRYINLTTRHHDGFCLFETQATSFSAPHSAARRDLVAELADACSRRGLGLCLYYSHGRDWRHPHAPDNDAWGGAARPPYDPPEPHYAYGDAHNLNEYLEFMRIQIRELLTQYGPIAAIWLDGIGVPLSGDAEAFRCQELYDEIHALQPQVLISYKDGLTGTEDFFAPEHRVPGAEGDRRGEQIRSHPEKCVEVCTTMTPGSWGFMASARGLHRSPEEVWQALEGAAAARANLLLNTGPLPDGNLDREDIETLSAVGRRIAGEGLPVCR